MSFVTDIQTDDSRKPFAHSSRYAYRVELKTGKVLYKIIYSDWVRTDPMNCKCGESYYYYDGILACHKCGATKIG